MSSTNSNAATKADGETKAVAPVELPSTLVRRGINEQQWRTLCNSLYPGAHPDSVLLVVDYCAARKLDPLKKPCHIVPMRVKDARSDKYVWRDVVLPGIYEYRTTAMRTGLYLGHSRPEFGAEIDVAGTKAPEWCEMTFFRALSKAQADVRLEFPVRVYFTEVVTLKDGAPNERWKKAPRQMLLKCTEAAGLREAFPDELGGESTAEELEGREIDGGEHSSRPAAVLPAQRKSAQQTPALKAAEVVDAEVVDDVDDQASENKSKVVDHPAKAQTEQADQPAAAQGSGFTPLPIGEASQRDPLGTVVDVRTGANGTVVSLSSGFRAMTRDESIRDAAQQAKQAGARVELITRPSSNPSKYAPTIEELLPAFDEAADPDQDGGVA